MCFGSSTMKLSTTKRVRSTVQFRGATSATSLLCSQNAAISSQISGCHFDPVIKNKGHNSTHTNKIDLSPPYSAFLQPPFGHSTEITNALQQTKPKKRLGTGMNAYQMQTNYSITKWAPKQNRTIWPFFAWPTCLLQNEGSCAHGFAWPKKMFPTKGHLVFIR